MKRKLINLLANKQDQSQEWLSRGRYKLNASSKSDYKVFKAKQPSDLRATLARVGNSVAVIGAFMGIAIMVNEPLRAELAKSIAPASFAMASIDSATDKNVDIESTPTMQPVSMGRPQFGASSSSDILTPEILQAPVPSIAPMAQQIQGRIDPAALDGRLMANKSDQQKVANFMANKYGLDPKAINQFVSHAVVVAKEVDLDPVLLVAVMSIESNFNPNAQSGAGAQGLMQVLTRVHAQKYAPYGGPAAAFKPEANIRVGAYILKYFIAQAGSLQGGLRYYVGGAVVGDGGYAGKVMREREQLNALLRNADLEVPLEVSSAPSYNKVLPAPVKPKEIEAAPPVPQIIEIVETKEQDS
jgi:Transglycosylase SLT domain